MSGSFCFVIFIFFDYLFVLFSSTRSQRQTSMTTIAVAQKPQHIHCRSIGRYSHRLFTTAAEIHRRRCGLGSVEEESGRKTRKGEKKPPSKWVSALSAGRIISRHSATTAVGTFIYKYNNVIISPRPKDITARPFANQPLLSLTPTLSLSSRIIIYIVVKCAVHVLHEFNPFGPHAYKRPLIYSCDGVPRIRSYRIALSLSFLFPADLARARDTIIIII